MISLLDQNAPFQLTSDGAMDVNPWVCMTELFRTTPRLVLGSGQACALPPAATPDSAGPNLDRVW
jgi:hypothetical protein